MGPPTAPDIFVVKSMLMFNHCFILVSNPKGGGGGGGGLCYYIWQFCLE